MPPRWKLIGASEAVQLGAIGAGTVTLSQVPLQGDLGRCGTDATTSGTGTDHFRFPQISETLGLWGNNSLIMFNHNLITEGQDHPVVSKTWVAASSNVH